MRYIKSSLLLALVALSGCGGGGGSSGGGAGAGACATSIFKGTWGENGGASDQYRFNADCTATNLNCTLVISRYNISVPGTLALQVSSTSGAGGCPAVGQTDCTYNFIDASNMSLNCGGLGVVNYSKTAP